MHWLFLAQVKQASSDSTKDNFTGLYYMGKWFNNCSQLQVTFVFSDFQPYFCKLITKGILGLCQSGVKPGTKLEYL